MNPQWEPGTVVNRGIFTFTGAVSVLHSWPRGFLVLRGRDAPCSPAPSIQMHNLFLVNSTTRQIAVFSCSLGMFLSLDQTWVYNVPTSYSLAQFSERSGSCRRKQPGPWGRLWPHRRQWWWRPSLAGSSVKRSGDQEKGDKLRAGLEEDLWVRALENPWLESTWYFGCWENKNAFSVGAGFLHLNECCFYYSISNENTNKTTF